MKSSVLSTKIRWLGSLKYSYMSSYYIWVIRMKKPRQRRRISLKHRIIHANRNQTVKLRIRCPCCGMLCWQKRLNGVYQLDFYKQTFAGDSSITYTKMQEVPEFRKLMAMRLISIAKSLDSSSVYQDVSITPTISTTPAISIKPRMSIQPRISVQPGVKIWR